MLYYFSQPRFLLAFLNQRSIAVGDSIYHPYPFFFILCFTYFSVFYSNISFAQTSLTQAAPPSTTYRYMSIGAMRKTADFIYQKHLIASDKQFYGMVVYVDAPDFGHFHAYAFPKISKPFVLVTGSGEQDNSIPSELYIRISNHQSPRPVYDKQTDCPNCHARDILDNPLLLHWFTVNYDGSVVHPKLTPIPLGPNFHRLDINDQGKPIHSRYIDWGEPKPYFEQESELARSAFQARHSTKRRLQIFYDAHLNETSRRWITHPLRQAYPHTKFLSRSGIAAFFKDRSFFHVQHKRQPRIAQWQDREHFLFSISPVGKGLDCYRTWESLILGQVVIVQKGPLDPLYADLPVVVVDSWEEVTPANLRTWSLKFREQTQDVKIHEKLGFDYWYKKVHGYKV